MKVYIAKANIDYEGFYIIGVFKSEEDAHKRCDEHGKTFFRADSYSVDEYEVQE